MFKHHKRVAYTVCTDVQMFTQILLYNSCSTHFN